MSHGCGQEVLGQVPSCSTSHLVNMSLVKFSLGRLLTWSTSYLVNILLGQLGPSEKKTLHTTSSIIEYIPLPGPTGPAVISNYAYIQNCFDSQSLFLKNILVSYHFSLNTSRSMQLLYGVFRLMQQLLDTSTAQNISHELTKAQNYHAQL